MSDLHSLVKGLLCSGTRFIGAGRVIIVHLFNWVGRYFYIWLFNPVLNSIWPDILLLKHNLKINLILNKSDLGLYCLTFEPTRSFIFRIRNKIFNIIYLKIFLQI